MLERDTHFLSLTTLNVGVQHMGVNITQTPNGCLSQINEMEFGKILQDFFLYNFQSHSPNASRLILEQDENICNMRMRSEEGRHAYFYYECCHVNGTGDIVCNELRPSTLMNALFVFIVVLNVMALLYAPLLLPSSLYTERYRTNTYEHKLDKPLYLWVRKTSTRNHAMNTIPLKKITKKSMTKFTNIIDEMEEEKPHKLKLSKLEVKLRMDELVPKDRAPVGIIDNLFYNLVVCKIRNRPLLWNCCHATLTPCGKLSWYRCLRSLTKLIFFLILSCPWGIRLAIYYLYEHPEIKERREFAADNSLHLTSTGSVISSLTPTHGLYIFCYCVLVLLTFVLSILSKKMQKLIYSAFQCSLNDMWNSSWTGALERSFVVLIQPLEKFGFLGILVLPFYWLIVLPCALAVMMFYTFPLINVLVRLFVNVSVLCASFSECKKCSHCPSSHRNFLCRIFDLRRLLADEKAIKVDTNKIDRSSQIFVLVMCLLGMFAACFLARECIVFVVEYTIYVVIGVILNADHTLKYVTIAFMVVLYIRDCFGSVGNKYQKFNAILHEAALEKAAQDIHAEVDPDDSANMEKNAAFVVPTTKHGKDVPIPDLYVKMAPHGPKGFMKYTEEEQLSWTMWQMAVFLNNKDKSFLSQDFFFQSIKMQNCKVPGSLINNYLIAFAKLLVILVFLFFVVLIVMVFGEEYNLSTFNQTIATLVTGFLPWALTNVLFKSADAFELDKENINFQIELDKLIRKFHQMLVVADIPAEVVSNTTNSHTDADIVDSNPTIPLIDGEDTTVTSENHISSSDYRDDEATRTVKVHGKDELIIYVPDRNGLDDTMINMGCFAI